MNALLATPEIRDVPEVDAEARSPVPETRRLFDLARPQPDDESELLRCRFLCRGGGLPLCGPTGVGKSSLAMQAMILWAIGKPCFDIVPVRPLKSLLIQAENDDGDLAEFRDGICAGQHLAADEIEAARENVIVVREDSLTSIRFFAEIVAPLLQSHGPDLLWIDPALAFLGGETASQRDVGTFLRNLLNPLLHAHDCAAVVVHHTNKPPKGHEKPDWQAGEFAYLGSGSAEWANWARAVLVVRSVGSHEVFELRAPKRGGRLGWREDDGETTAYAKRIAHSRARGIICWREAEGDELSGNTSTRGRTKADLLPHVPTSRPILKAVLIQRVSAVGIGQNAARAFLAELIEDGVLHEWRRKRARTNPEISIARDPQPDAQL